MEFREIREVWVKVCKEYMWRMGRLEKKLAWLDEFLLNNIWFQFMLNKFFPSDEAWG